MRQISLNIASKDFNITLDDEFADYFEEELRHYLDDKNLLTIKALLTAFIQKCYENYEQKNETFRPLQGARPLNICMC